MSLTAPTVSFSTHYRKSYLIHDITEMKLSLEWCGNEVVSIWVFVCITILQKLQAYLFSSRAKRSSNGSSKSVTDQKQRTTRSAFGLLTNSDIYNCMGLGFECHVKFWALMFGLVTLSDPRQRCSSSLKTLTRKLSIRPILTYFYFEVACKSTQVYQNILIVTFH